MLILQLLLFRRLQSLPALSPNWLTNSLPASSSSYLKKLRKNVCWHATRNLTAFSLNTLGFAGSLLIPFLVCWYFATLLMHSLFQSLCSIYKEGSGRQRGKGTAFELARHLSSPSCPRRVEVGGHVAFQPHPPPTTFQGSCVNSSSTPTTTISLYRRKNDVHFYTSNPNAVLPSESNVARRLIIFVISIYISYHSGGALEFK